MFNVYAISRSFYSFFPVIYFSIYTTIGILALYLLSICHDDVQTYTCKNEAFNVIPNL